MKKFVLGLLVGAVVGAGAMLAWTHMPGAEGEAAKTAAWLDALGPARTAIAAKARASGSLAGAGVGIALPALPGEAPAYQGVGTNGTIVLRGGQDGQVVLLVPMLANGNVSWQCLGGSKASVPDYCAGTSPGTLPD
jgi:hypothetical protein